MFCLLKRIASWRLLFVWLLVSPLRADEPSVVAAVKLPPVKTLADKSVGLMRHIFSEQQAEFYSFMVLGALGYPKFQGVSETEAVTLFFFASDRGEPTPYVIMAKMDATAPLRKKLTHQAKGDNLMAQMMAPGLSAIDRDGWTLFAKDPAWFDYITDMDALEKMSASIDGHDITARLYIGPAMAAKWADRVKESIADDHVKAGKLESDSELLHKQLFVEFLGEIGANLEWVQTGITLDDKVLAYGATVQASADTPEAALLFAKAGGATQAAELLAMGTISYVNQIDHQALLDYYNVLHDRAMLIATDDGKKWLERAAEINRQLIAKTSSSAGSIRFEEGRAMNQSLIATELDYATLNQALRFYHNELIPEVFQRYGLFGVEMKAVDTEFAVQVAEVQGQSVDRVDTTYAKLKISWLGEDDDEESAPEQAYYAVLNGFLLSASNLEDMEALAQQVVDGKPVEGNVASRIKLEEGQVLGWEMDVSSLAEKVTASYEPQTLAARQAIAGLIKSDLLPITGSLTVGKGQGSYEFVVPMDAIQKVSQTFQEVKRAEMEMETHGAGQSTLPPE